jgi:TatD DNase family protein
MFPFINIHTHHPSEYKCIEIINAENPEQVVDNGLYSYGLHPWDIEKKGSSISELENLLKNKKLTVVGETGIDRAINTDIELQKKVFIEQCQLAENYQIPVIIHCVRAYTDIAELNKMLKPTVPWIFHGFTANLQIADQLIKRGCYLSIGPAILNNNKLQDTLIHLPLEKLFLETDFQPIPISEIYKKVADIKEISIDILANQLKLNFSKALSINL